MEVEWISVNERLPKRGEEVLCWDAARQWFYFVEYNSRIHRRTGEEIETWVDGNGRFLEEVTHWSTLPNRPPESAERWPNEKGEWPDESYPVG